jgi:hypothetical protein
MANQRRSADELIWVFREELSKTGNFLLDQHCYRAGGGRLNCDHWSQKSGDESGSHEPFRSSGRLRAVYRLESD